MIFDLLLMRKYGIVTEQRKVIVPYNPAFFEDRP